MKKKIIYALIVLILAGGAIFAVKHKKERLDAQPIPAKDSAVVKTYEPRFGEVKLYLNVLAQVASDNEINFSPRFGSRVEFVAPLGASLKRGALVSKVDSNELRAELESAKSDVAAKEGAFENIKQAHERSLELYRVGGVSKEQIESEEAALRASNAALKASKARVETLNNSIGYASLYAPFDGVVSQKFANSGDFVPQGKSVVIFSGFDGKYLQTKLPQNQSAKAIVYDGKEYPLLKTESSPDSLSSYIARAKNIKEGIGAKISVKALVFDGNATFLPSDTILKREDGYYILTLEGSVARALKINILASGEDGYATDAKIDGKKIALAKPDALLRAFFGVKVETAK